MPETGCSRPFWGLVPLELAPNTDHQFSVTDHIRRRDPATNVQAVELPLIMNLRRVWKVFSRFGEPAHVH